MARTNKRKDYVAPSRRETSVDPADERARRSASREERASAAQRDARRQRTRRVLGVGASAGVLLLAVAGYVVYDNRKDAALERTLTAGGVCATDDETDPTDAPGSNHVPAPTFAVDPPAGGNHTAGVSRAGVLRGEAATNLGPIVHALEHGYVVLWQRPDLAEEQRKVLTDLAASRPEDVLVVERPGLPVPVAATAWGQRLLCQQAVTAPLAAFADEYVGDGPEDVPRG